jgi:hypothetical protein
MTWRDGQRATGPESALSVSMLKFRRNGTVDRIGATRVLLRSNNLSWTKFRDGAGVTVIHGQPWVTWNYLSDAGGRKSRTGRLIVNGTGRAATFAVR